MSTYADDVSVIVLDTKQINVIGTTLSEYEAVTGAKINQKSVGLQLDTWRGKSISSKGVNGRWTDRLNCSGSGLVQPSM